MDPNENLKEQLAVCEEIYNCAHDRYKQADLAEQLADLVESLNTWIVTGGPLPENWKR